MIGIAGLAIALAIPLRLLVPNSMDPSVYLALGEDSPQTAYAQRLLGEVWTRPGLGHDGRFFFVQATDPWYLHPDESAALLDRPIYRAQRMLFPTIAGGFGSFPPDVIVWSMLVTNVVSLAAGSVFAARLARSWGIPTWLGLLVPLNIGLLFEFEIGGAGILAFSCCLGGLDAIVRRRTTWASLWFAAAALAREEMLLFAVGVFLVTWLNEHRFVWRIVVTPVAATAVWFAFLLWRLVGVSGTGGARGAFAPPFAGLVEASRSWVDDPWTLVANLALLSVMLLFVPLALRSRLPIAWGALPFIGLAGLLSAAVWRETFDLSRAVAPVFTAAPFVVVYSDRAG